MYDDDEIIGGDQPLLSGDDARAHRPNRGFWLVAGTLILACIVLLVEIFANRPIANDIGNAQHALRVAQARAAEAFSQTGSYTGADAAGLSERWPGDELTYSSPGDASVSLTQVSVSAAASVWAAAVQIRPGACFYLKLEAGAKDPLYGVGTECTATRALTSEGDRW